MIAQASVAGEAARLFQLVDNLTAELLASSYAEPRERLTRTAAITTHSIPALKAYLVGESHLRAARYGPAVEAFQRAVAEDSTFALAYYRLSLAAEWAARLDVEIDGADRAARHHTRLAERDRLLVQALHARRRGAADQAERLYRTVLARHPDDVEAWHQLGEVLFHQNAYRGRSLVESRRVWERVLALEPDHRDALVHLARVAAREGKRTELDSLLTRALALSPASERLELRAFRAFALGTRADQDRVVEELRTAELPVLWQSAWRITVYLHDLAGAERVARLMVEPSRPPATRSSGHELLMMLLQGQGRRQAALAEGSLVQRPIPWSPKAGHPVFATPPLFPVDPAALADLRDRLTRWDAFTAATSETSTPIYRDLYPQVREYFLGRLSVRLGESALAWRHAYSGWLRAELLRELGRDQEALAWYASRVDLFVNEVIYLAPAHLRQAEIHERVGNRNKAIEHYQRFVELWKTCDPELRPMLSDVQRRIARLQRM